MATLNDTLTEMFLDKCYGSNCQRNRFNCNSINSLIGHIKQVLNLRIFTPLFNNRHRSLIHFFTMCMKGKKRTRRLFAFINAIMSLDDLCICFNCESIINCKQWVYLLHTLSGSAAEGNKQLNDADKQNKSSCSQNIDHSQSINSHLNLLLLITSVRLYSYHCIF